MPSPDQVYRLIHAAAPGFADQLRAAAAASHNETELRTVRSAQLRAYSVHLPRVRRPHASLHVIRNVRIPRFEGKPRAPAPGGPVAARACGGRHDVVVPEMKVRELAKHLGSAYPHLRCLFMSGYTANAVAHRGVPDEGVHLVQKPFSARDLAAHVREALASQ
jgi:DNA-binding NarL/FixJ family response regulator